MKKIFTMFFLTLLVNECLLPQTIVPGGNVSGSWTQSGSPYLINGDITVSENNTLTIEQGVHVIFQDNFNFLILGDLIATGAISDSVYFTVDDTTGYFNNTHKGWGGLFTEDYMEDYNNITLNYCIIEYSKTYCIYSQSETHLWLYNSHFRYSFGGVYVNFNAIMSNLIISDNRGHGINYDDIYEWGDNTVVNLDNFIIRNNTGNGIKTGGYMPRFHGTHGQIISNKSAGVYIGNTIEAFNYVSLIDVNIEKNGNLNEIGGGLLNEARCFLDSVYISENAALNGGGIYYREVDLGGTEPGLHISNSVIEENIAVEKGGGICTIWNSTNFHLNNSIIRNNQATDGGGLYIDFNSMPSAMEPKILSLNNIEISANHATNIGGGIYLNIDDHGGPKNISQLTIVNNIADNLGSGIYHFWGNPVGWNDLEFKSSIIWNNPGNEITDLSGNMNLNYSDIEDSWPGTGNINADPLFVNPVSGNYDLMWVNFPPNDYTKSPCIDSGDPTSPNDPDGTTADMGAYPFNQTGQTMINLDVKVFLEGPFLSGQMTPFLNVLGYVPLAQPYNVPPWNYHGVESVTSIPNYNVVDWVLVDLLARAQQSQTYYFLGRKAAFILKSGTIKDLDGTSNIVFSTVVPGDYYIRIHHRNHLSVMSANPLTENTGVYSYDFTTGAIQAFGDVNTQKELSPGIWGMIAADGNASGEVDNKDKNDIWIPEYGQIGYLKGDFDLNSQVDIYDKTNKWATNAGKGITNLQYLIAPNIPPISPSNQQPIDGATIYDLNTDLSWECTDPEGSLLTYSIYFGTAIDPPIIESNYIGTIYSLINLNYLSNYYWRIVATDIEGDSTSSSVWMFSVQFDPSLPTVTTAIIQYITPTTATSGGEVLSNGAGTVNERGVCWNTSPNPTTANSKTVDGSGTGVFVSNITGLIPNTLYYVRAYATNNEGTAYGNELTLTTLLNPIVPTVITSTVTNITQTTATSGGNVLSDGGAVVVFRGVCWNTSPNPTTLNSKTVDGSGTGLFVSNLIGLAANTIYYIRAYAVNTVGTSYGNEFSFTTFAVSTNQVTNITQTTATSGGNVNGVTGVTSRGVCWNTSPNPTTANSKTVDSSGTGSFVSNLTGLNQNTLYYVRAYAVHSLGTSYGNEVIFTTLIAIPTVTTNDVINITQTTATSGGNVSGYGVTSRGVCWNTSPNPTIANSKTVDGSGEGTFVSNLTGLTQNTLYYVRAYATNSTGTAYGNQKTFTTTILPTVTTTEVTNITTSTATSGGNVSGYGVTSRGVCWNTSPNPTIENSKTIDGSGPGVFVSNIAGLTPNTLYYLRSYATNTAGTAYGNELSFTTILNPIIPTVTTNEVTNIYQISATCGGNVTSQGGAVVTFRGVCWNTSPNPTTANSKTIDGSGEGSFVSNLTGLMPNTLYYVRAYATNTAGTAYGNELSFTTLNFQSPTLTTATPINILDFTTTSGGNIISDGGSPVIFRGVCWSILPSPTITDSKTADGVGAGLFFSHITGLIPNTLYYVKAYAVNDIGVGYGNELSFTTSSDLTCLGMPTITYGEKTYYTIQIGSQCWLRENLNIGTMINSSNSQTNNGLIEKYCYNNDPANCTTFGGLYQWNEMMQYSTAAGTKGICPDGWHLPTDAEWTTLSISLGGASVAGGKMKEQGTEQWLTPNTSATNSSGFTGIPGGAYNNSFILMGNYNTLWTSSKEANNPLRCDLYYNSPILNIFVATLSSVGCSVRCIRNLPIGDLPTVTTNSIVQLTCNSVIAQGTVTNEGFSPVTERGFCWNYNNFFNPTINDFHTHDGSGLGSFSSQITGLWPEENMIIYFRAYATNSVGTAYGNLVTFYLVPIQTITTTPVTNITSSTATSGGVVDLCPSGFHQFDEKGVCWNTSPNPTIENSKTVDGSDYGSFVSNLTGLTPNTLYYVIAYATDNTEFTYYGNQISFTTAHGVLPFVQTENISNITLSTATGGGNVIDEGFSAVTARGVCWSINQNPTIVDPHTFDGTGLGSFISNLTGLTQVTTYYVRAYATNTEGMAYGNEISFQTIGSCPGIPTVLYDGQTYNTIQIGSQCWLRENLNIGTMINSSGNQTNNGIIEKYCYNNDPVNCTTYGGLYQWNETMQYTTMAGTKGICPDGWHLPTDAEWCTLENYVDQGTVSCTTTGWRGSDCGTNLKVGGSGFEALLSGQRAYNSGSFNYLGVYGNFWTSTNGVVFRRVGNSYTNIYRASATNTNGFSVRCLKD
jgi:uncharacterized protein (TIGR02145 family)